jgi:hypothetical protein
VDNQEAFLPPTKSYRMDFVFDGHFYVPTPSTADAMRLFERK